MNKDFYVGGTRILTPLEADIIYSHIPLSKYRSTYMFYLCTGIRYTEGLYPVQHPECFDSKNRIICMKSDRSWNREWMFRDRNVFLSYHDIPHVALYLKDMEMVKRAHLENQVLKNYMRRWGNECGLGTEGMGTKTLRKTRFAWLVHAFPDYLPTIIDSIDHLSSAYHSHDETIDDYLSIPFTRRDITMIACRLYGWSGATIAPENSQTPLP